MGSVDSSVDLAEHGFCRHDRRYDLGAGPMIRQYGAQRSMGGPNPLRVGIIPVGAIFYLQDDGWWRERHCPKPICREPWIVEGFFNGVMGAARRNRETGHWESVYLAGRSDIALVRSLRDGRLARVAVRTLILHEDEGLRRDEATYPTRPNLSLYRLGRPRLPKSRLAA